MTHIVFEVKDLSLLLCKTGTHSWKHRLKTQNMNITHKSAAWRTDLNLAPHEYICCHGERGHLVSSTACTLKKSHLSSAPSEKFGEALTSVFSARRTVWALSSPGPLLITAFTQPVIECIYSTDGGRKQAERDGGKCCKGPGYTPTRGESGVVCKVCVLYVLGHQRTPWLSYLNGKYS